MVPLIKTDDLNDRIISEEKIADSAVTTPKIADGSITEDKMSEDMERLIKGWNDTTELVGTLPKEMVTEMDFDAREDEVAVDLTISHYEGDDGYQDIYRSITFPAATQDNAGTLSADDKRLIDDWRENGPVQDISEEEIEEITND